LETQNTFNFVEEEARNRRKVNQLIISYYNIKINPTDVILPQG